MCVRAFICVCVCTVCVLKNNVPGLGMKSDESQQLELGVVTMVTPYVQCSHVHMCV